MRKKSCGYLHQARYNFARTQPRSNSEHQPCSNNEHKPRSNSEHQLRSNNKHHLTRPKFARNNNSLTEILTKHKAQSTKHKAQSTKTTKNDQQRYGKREVMIHFARIAKSWIASLQSQSLIQKYNEETLPSVQSMISDLKRKGSKSTTMAAPQESENPTNKNKIEFVSPFNDNTIESVTTGKDAIFLDDNRKTRHNKRPSISRRKGYKRTWQ